MNLVVELRLTHRKTVGRDLEAALADKDGAIEPGEIRERLAILGDGMDAHVELAVAVSDDGKVSAVGSHLGLDAFALDRAWARAQLTSVADGRSGCGVRRPHGQSHGEGVREADTGLRHVGLLRLRFRERGDMVRRKDCTATRLVLARPGSELQRRHPRHVTERHASASKPAPCPPVEARESRRVRAPCRVGPRLLRKKDAAGQIGVSRKGRSR
ncbi:hypothetical protein L1887_44533 [Cichorium endivia]|nr:hypothetical protein L1887_44533 [Cichorium endivia]